MSRPEVHGYEVGPEIGRGGMGTVFRARTPAGDAVAIKVVRDTSNDAERARFLREARIRIDHPNVVRTIGAGLTQSGDPYLVLELLEGESLEARLRPGPLSPALALEVSLAACRGLEAAHAAGIVHRDVKPANVFLVKGGGVKLLDFGVARASGGTSVTATGQILGTPAYLAPEQARGSTAIGPEADVWAMGVTLYRCLTGLAPFERPTPLATALSVLVDDPAPIAVLSPGVPIALATIVHRCLEKRPAERYRDAGELRAALETVELDGSGPTIASTLDAGAPRIVTLVLAGAVRDETTVLSCLREAGAVTLALPDRTLVGVLGAPRSDGGELARATLAAEAIVASAGIVVVVGGRVGRVGESAELLGRAQALGAGSEGVVVLDETSARALGALGTPLPGGGYRWSASEAAPTGPWVNRDEELRTLTTATSRALGSDRAAAILVSGPPGIGKSALLERSLGAIRAGGAAPTIARVQAGLSRSREALGTVSAALKSVGITVDLDGGAGRPELGAHGPGAADRRRVACFDAMSDLCARGPLVVLIDDAEAADAASLELLCDLAVELEGSPFCVLFATNDEGESLRPFTELPAETTRAVRLGPLEVHHTRELLAALGTPARSVGPIADRSQGVPLFAIELARAVGDDAPEAATIPVGIEAAIQVVLDRLGAAELAVLRILAVFRRPASVEDVVALGDPDAERTLGALVRRGLVQTTRAGADRARRHNVRHPLVQSVVLERLEPARRTELHARAAGWLATRDAPDLEEIAHHRAGAGARTAAASLYADVASDAAADGDAHTALRCAELAITLGPPEHRAFDVHLAYADAALFLGMVEAREEALGHALSVASGDVPRARALTELSEHRFRLGKPQQALELATEALALARSAASADAITRAAGRIAIVRAAMGDELGAAALLDEIRPIARTASALARGFLADVEGYVASRRGDHSARAAAYREAEARYTDAGDLRRANGARQNLADVWNRVGRYDEAERALALAVPTCRKLGNRLTETYALLNLAYATSRLGRPTEALATLEKVRALLARAPNTHAAFHERLYRARTLAAAEPGAPATIALATELGRDGAAPDGIRASALALAAELTALAGRSGLVLAEEALALTGDLVEDEADAFLSAARALESERPDQARNVRSQARERVLRAAARIGDPAMRALFLEAVPAHAELTVGGP